MAAKKQNFTLWTDKPIIRENVIRAIKALPDDIVWDIKITKHVNSKSAKQRGWLHVLCGMMGEELGMSMGNFKEIAKAQIFGWKHIAYAGVELTMADGHSEDLKMDDYAKLIDVVYQLAGDAGITLPEPDPEWGIRGNR